MRTYEGYRRSKDAWHPSDAQRRVLDEVSAGRLGLSVGTVKWHVAQLLGESGCADRRELARWWQTHRADLPARIPFLLLLRLLARASLPLAAIVLGVVLYAVDGSGMVRMVTTLVTRPLPPEPAAPLPSTRPTLSDVSSAASVGPQQPADAIWEQRAGSVPLSRPVAVAVDQHGNVYVAELESATVQKFDSSGVFLMAWGGEGTAAGQFVFRTPVDPAAAITVDEQGWVYVADATGRVQLFDSDGSYLRTLRPMTGGTPDLRWPSGLQVDRDGVIYVSDLYMQVSDAGTAQVYKLAADGTVAARWGEPGTAAGRFMGASGVALSATGTVYVIDHLNHRVQVFDADGRFVTTWGRAGQGDGEFLSPTGVAVDREGNVYIADTRNDRIQKFDADGRFLAQGGRRGTGAGEFLTASKVAVDASGDLIVVDAGGRRIQKIRLP